MSQQTQTAKEIPGKCPTPVEMGNSGWNILHGAAAVYPYKPTAEQRQAMQELIRGFSYFYPCNWCAYHMRLYLKEHSPDLSDKLSVSRFFCEFHNNVNEHLGKPQYDCDPANVLRRWHPGYPDKMEDRPSMEERIAAEQQRLQQQQQQQHQAEGGKGNENKSWSTRDAPAADFTTNNNVNSESVQKTTSGLPPSSVPPLSYMDKDIDTLGATATRSSSSWWSWLPGSHRTSTRQNTVSTALNDKAAPVANVTTTNTNTTNAAVVPPTSGPAAASVAANEEIAVHSRKVADSETNIELILRRLKGCHVYCPEDEDKLKK